MKYDFDKIIDRKNSNCLKWDTAEEGVLPMWVADMDFAVADPILKALQKRLEHPVFGYGITPGNYYGIAARWVERRHGFKPEEQWFSHCPGVVPGLHFLAQCMVKPGDRIIMLTPVYYPFFEAAQRNGIEVSASQLIYRNQRYEIDFDDFEKKAKEPEVRMFYFCSPHNPGGRLWTREEIERLGRICIENGIIIVSDEIHSDLLMPGERHIVTASVSKEIADNSITFIAPSKTFNLAGLQTSLIMIPNPSLKDIFDRFTARLGIKRPNVFGISALMASYEHGDEWLDQLLIYLKNNVECVKEYLSEHIPEAKMMIPQAGYLVWIDFSGLKFDPKEFHEALLNTGKIWLDEGYMFGEPGYGFERINVACPRSVLIDGLKRIKKTIDYLRK